MALTIRPSSIAALAALLLAPAAASRAGFEVRCEVDFGATLRPWDGFGVNYVEAAQTRDYVQWPQDYGGFSTLPPGKRDEILRLIFDEGGIEPGLLKMFLDPFHEGMTAAGNDNADPDVLDMSRFDHATTTRWMRFFAQEALRRTRARGADLQVITTLYGPPPWVTKQRFVRGRDLDPAMKRELGEYMVSWVKYLRETEKIPVRYLSLHNEGEDFSRWPTDGSWGSYARHDHNMYWPPSQVVDFLTFLPGMLAKQGLGDVGVTPGETSNWHRFTFWGYAWLIGNTPDALANLALSTSHSFGMGQDHTGIGNEYLRLARPDLKAWTTSMTWGRMDVDFVDLVRTQIYEGGVNGVIPWATIQTSTWTGGDPNPGTAFRVDGKGGYTVEPGYHYFKQLSRAGQPGMAVARADSEHPQVRLVAFARKATRHPDAFVVYNLTERREDLVVRVAGTSATSFEGFVTSPGQQYAPLGTIALRNGAVEVTVHARSVVTFFARR